MWFTPYGFWHGCIGCGGESKQHDWHPLGLSQQSTPGQVLKRVAEERSGGEHICETCGLPCHPYCVGYTRPPRVHMQYTCTHVPPVVEVEVVNPAVDQRGGLSRDQWNAVLVDGEVLVGQHDLVLGKGGDGAKEQGEEEQG